MAFNSNLPIKATKDRLRGEIKALMSKTELQAHGITVEMSDNIRELSAIIKGPDGSPYEGGSFHVDVKIPTRYPYEPPKITFKTKIWHPNICSRSGYICVDILKEKWTAALDLTLALLTVQNLLLNPDDESPQDIDVGAQMRESMDEFQRTARVWTKIFNTGNDAPGDPEFNAKLNTLMELNICWLGEGLRFLSTNHWNLEAAVEHFAPEF